MEFNKTIPSFFEHLRIVEDDTLVFAKPDRGPRGFADCRFKNQPANIIAVAANEVKPPGSPAHINGTLVHANSRMLAAT